MRICNICNGTSPDDAKFCIECGKAIIATGDTKRLRTTRVGPYIDSADIYEIPHGGYIEYDSGYHTPAFIEDVQPYYAYREDLGAILKDTSTYIRKTETGYELYYRYRKVVFLD